MWPVIQINNFSIYSYPLFMGLAWGFAYQFAANLLNKNANLGGFRGLFWGSFASSWMGAKLFFLLTPGASLSYLQYSSFWFGGGFVFYGGLILGAAYVLFYSLVLKKFDIKNAIYILPSLAYGHAIGRIGCFMAGCCYGKNCLFFWCVKHQHPVQLYEAVALIILGTIIFQMIKRAPGSQQLIIIYFIAYAVIRLITEVFRADPGRGFIGNYISTSQFISLLIISGALILRQTMNTMKS